MLLCYQGTMLQVRGSMEMFPKVSRVDYQTRDSSIVAYMIMIN